MRVYDRSEYGTHEADVGEGVTCVRVWPRGSVAPSHGADRGPQRPPSRRGRHLPRKDQPLFRSRRATPHACHHLLAAGRAARRRGWQACRAAPCRAVPRRSRHRGAPLRRRARAPEQPMPRLPGRAPPRESPASGPRPREAAAARAAAAARSKTRLFSTSLSSPIHPLHLAPGSQRCSPGCTDALTERR